MLVPLNHNDNTPLRCTTVTDVHKSKHQFLDRSGKSIFSSKRDCEREIKDPKPKNIPTKNFGNQLKKSVEKISNYFEIKKKECRNEF